jgi:hypothetical protein
VKKRARKGFAVLLAIFAILLMGALATSMVFAAGEETRASAAALRSTDALSRAESALALAAARTDWAAAMVLRPGQVSRMYLTEDPRTAVLIARLDTTLFMLQAIHPDPLTSASNAGFIRRVGLTIELVRDSAGAIRPLRLPNRAWVELF